MTHQEELMKDWSLKRRFEVLFTVCSNFYRFMKYSPEELMTLQQNNRDAFDLFEAIMIDIATKQNQSSELLSEDF